MNKNKRINLSEVAKAAGVSKMTASRVLRDGGGFSEATRQRVLAEVDRLGYVPNRMASAFAVGGTSPFVGVSIPDLAHEAFTQILDGIDRKLGSFGQQAVLGMTRHQVEEEERWIETVLSWQPAGLILTGRLHSPRANALLRSSGVPIVEIWDLNSTPIDMCVGLSHYDAGYEMGRFLLERGYRNVGYVGTNHGGSSASGLRLSGYSDAIQNGGGTNSRFLCVNDIPAFYPGFYGTEQLLNSKPNVEAIFYQNDNMAVGGYEYCASKGMRIPDDIGIAGWGDLPALSVFREQLTTTRIRHVRLGQLAAEKLLSKQRGGDVKKVSDIGYRIVPGSTT